MDVWVERESDGGRVSRPAAEGPARPGKLLGDLGRVSTVTASSRFRRRTAHPPVAERRRYPPLSLIVLPAHEPGVPEGRDPIRWQLLTDLPIDDLPGAVEKLDGYARRWKIETFHKVLKSGGRAEESRLRTAG